MKTAMYGFLIVLALVVLVPAGTVAADDLEDRLPYNVLAEHVFSGVVDQKPYVLNGTTYFVLRTEKGIATVHMGPWEFVKRIGLKLETGEAVMITGVPIVIGNREAIMAREITTTAATFAMRDLNGLPLWDKDRPVQIDPEIGNISTPPC